jgi:hypothetical protein
MIYFLQSPGYGTAPFVLFLHTPNSFCGGCVVGIGLAVVVVAIEVGVVAVVGLGVVEFCVQAVGETSERQYFIFGSNHVLDGHCKRSGNPSKQ